MCCPNWQDPFDIVMCVLTCIVFKYMDMEESDDLSKKNKYFIILLNIRAWLSWTVDFITALIVQFTMEYTTAMTASTFTLLGVYMIFCGIMTFFSFIEFIETRKRAHPWIVTFKIFSLVMGTCCFCSVYETADDPKNLAWHSWVVLVTTCIDMFLNLWQILIAIIHGCKDYRDECVPPSSTTVPDWDGVNGNRLKQLSL